MDSRYSRKIFGWIILLFFILACVSPLAQPPTPLPLLPARMQEDFDTAIAETAAVARTQTATMFTPTFTPSNTPSPTQTPTVTFTPTPTFRYFLVTATGMPAMEVESLTPLSGSIIDLGSSGDFRLEPLPTEKYTEENQWRCAVRRIPKPVVRPGQYFYAYWVVVNTGWNAWGSNTIDFIYEGGIRGDHTNIQDISSTVGYGRTLSIGAMFTAPSRPGEFISRYMLKVDATRTTDFCRLKMTFRVE